MKKTVNVVLFDDQDTWSQEFEVGKDVFFTGMTRTKGGITYLEVVVPSSSYKKLADAYRPWVTEDDVYTYSFNPELLK